MNSVMEVLREPSRRSSAAWPTRSDAFLADIRDVLGRDPTDWGNGQVP